MTLTTFTSRAAAALVAAVAGVISYGHIRQVANASGETELAAALLPLGIDGLIVVATLAMLEDKRAHRYPRLSARYALVFGVVSTIAFNVGSAAPTWTARAVAAVPALSFLIAVEVLARSGRPRPAADDSTAAEVSTPPPSDVDNPAPAVSTTRPARKVAPRRQNTAEQVARIVARTPGISPATVASRLKVSERTVQRHWPTPPVDTTPPNGVPDDAARIVAEVTS